jgi:hypothetical protein
LAQVLAGETGGEKIRFRRQRTEKANIFLERDLRKTSAEHGERARVVLAEQGAAMSRAV